uniref:Uncharacterized protein n=1 Tax=Solanum lycopersicum TaxID=4081 RepID=A0A3Q7IEN0_SOLLC
MDSREIISRFPSISLLEFALFIATFKSEYLELLDELEDDSCCIVLVSCMRTCLCLFGRLEADYGGSRALSVWLN